MENVGKTALVHKQDAEGSLTIDTATGFILTPMDERPDWAENLNIANTAERHMFYMERLAHKDAEGNVTATLYTDEMKTPDVIAFEDLMWTGVREYPADAPYINTETGAPESHEVITVEPDFEFRQQVLSQVLDITSELDAHGNETGSIRGAEVEVAISQDNLRTAEELEALEQDKQAGFKAVNE